MKLHERKRINAILYFAEKSSDYKIKRLKLMKLLWLADRIHLNRYGRTILRDQYFALPCGPIASNTMDLSEKGVDEVFSVDDYTITAEDHFDPKYFSRSDLNVMEEVWEKYGHMIDNKLVDLSHKFPEWKKFEDGLNDPDKPNRYLIDMDDFFKDAEENANYEYNSEQSGNAKEIYSENSTIQEALS